MAEQPDVPPLVRAAEAHAARTGFALSCRPEVGRLLRALAASKPTGRIAESGTGVGVGTAWLHAGLAPAASLVTVDHDLGRAGDARQLFAADPRVQVLTGDWRLLEASAPFDVFFCDGGGKREDPDLVISLLSPGGILVLDDFTPSPNWPPLFDGQPDELRLRYLTDPRVHTCQVNVSTDMTVVLATCR